MTKTVVVVVERRMKHGQYGKYLTVKKKFKAHDETKCLWHRRPRPHLRDPPDVEREGAGASLRSSTKAEGLDASRPRRAEAK